MRACSRRESLSTEQIGDSQTLHGKGTSICFKAISNASRHDELNMHFRGVHPKSWLLASVRTNSTTTLFLVTPDSNLLGICNYAYFFGSNLH